MIHSFNIQTNNWLFRHIYKRLQFLDVKILSQACVLLLLCVWQGFHSGCYVTFFNEFIIILLEREFADVILTERCQHLVTDWPVLSNILGWMYINAMVPHCFLAFPLLTADRYLPVMEETSFFLYQFVWVSLLITEGVRLLKKIIQ